MHPIVVTQSGKVEGRSVGRVQVFRGIPYARAERWQPPQPPEPWSGVRSARDTLSREGDDVGELARQRWERAGP